MSCPPCERAKRRARKIAGLALVGGVVFGIFLITMKTVKEVRANAHDQPQP